MKKNLRIILAGPGAVGKTTFLRRLAEGKFHEHMDFTVAYEESTTNVKSHKVSILDVGGQPQFRKDRIAFYEIFEPDGIIFMFSLSRKRSLKGVEEFLNEVFAEIDYIPFMLVGSKADEWDKDNIKDTDLFELQGRFKSVLDKLTKSDLPYLNISSKTGQNIEKVFPLLIKTYNW